MLSFNTNILIGNMYNYQKHEFLVQPPMNEWLSRFFLFSLTFTLFSLSSSKYTIDQKHKDLRMENSEKKCFYFVLFHFIFITFVILCFQYCLVTFGSNKASFICCYLILIFFSLFSLEFVFIFFFCVCVEMLHNIKQIKNCFLFRVWEN